MESLLPGQAAPSISASPKRDIVDAMFAGVDDEGEMRHSRIMPSNASAHALAFSPHQARAAGATSGATPIQIHSARDTPVGSPNNNGPADHFVAPSPSKNGGPTGSLTTPTANPQPPLVSPTGGPSLVRPQASSSTNSAPSRTQQPAVVAKPGASASALPPAAPAFSTAITIKEQSYIPLALAKRKVEAMEGDMRAMKERHLAALSEVQRYYERVEEESRNSFVAFLKQFRKETRAHQRELSNKAQSELSSLKESSSLQIASLEARLTSVEGELATALKNHAEEIAKLTTDSSAVLALERTTNATEREQLQAKIESLTTQLDEATKSATEAMAAAAAQAAATEGLSREKMQELEALLNAEKARVERFRQLVTTRDEVVSGLERDRRRLILTLTAMGQENRQLRAELKDQAAAASSAAAKAASISAAHDDASSMSAANQQLVQHLRAELEASKRAQAAAESQCAALSGELSSLKAALKGAQEALALSSAALSEDLRKAKEGTSQSPEALQQQQQQETALQLARTAAALAQSTAETAALRSQIEDLKARQHLPSASSAPSSPSSSRLPVVPALAIPPSSPTSSSSVGAAAPSPATASATADDASAAATAAALAAAQQQALMSRNAALAAEVRALTEALQKKDRELAAAVAAASASSPRASTLREALAAAEQVLATGEALWADKKRKQALDLYHAETGRLAGLLKEELPQQQEALRAASAEADAHLAEAQPGKASVCLKEAIDNFVAALRAELAPAPAPAIITPAAPIISPAAAVGISVDAASADAEALSLLNAAVASRDAEIAALKAQLLEATSAAAAAASSSRNKSSTSDDDGKDDEGGDDNGSDEDDGVEREESKEDDDEGDDEEAKQDEEGGAAQSKPAATGAAPATPAKQTGGATTAAGKTPATAGAKAAAAATAGAAAAGAAAASAGGARAASEGAKVRELEKTVKELRTKVRGLEAAAAAAKGKPGGGGGAAGGIDAKALDEALAKRQAVLEKKFKKEKEDADKDHARELDAVQRRLTKATAELAEANTALQQAISERDGLKRRLGGLGELEKEVEALRAVAEEAKQLRKDIDSLTARNAELDKLYRDEMLLRKKYHNIIEDMKGKIRVYARCRPISTSERERGNVMVVNFPDDVTVDLDCGPRGRKQFIYDKCFGPLSRQEEVFQETENLIQSAFDGYNVAIFAYGQTGSGKTFTMVGSKDMPGLTPRAIRRLYEVIAETKGTYDVTVSAYMVELYLDNLIDLFYKLDNPRDKNNDLAPKLEIKKDDKGLVTIKGVTLKECATEQAVMDLFEAGNAVRHTSATAMNATSSRSHLVFALLINSFNKQTKKTATGKLSMIDLAGSERVAKTGATADRLKEATAINRSLSALGNVISALSTNAAFIPYRDNKLTQLMSDSLGGNAKTLCFVNFSPVDYNAEETQSSLVYAARIKLITNSAEKQQETAEIQRLKKIIATLKAGGTVAESEELSAGPAGGSGADGDSGGGAGGGGGEGEEDELKQALYFEQQAIAMAAAGDGASPAAGAGDES